MRSFNVLDDEDLLARLDQPELPPRDFFDGGRIVAQPPRLFGEPRVLGTFARHGRRQRVVLTADAKHRQQPAVARERVEDDDDGDEQQADVQQPLVARVAAYRVRMAAKRTGSVGRRHVGRKVQQKREKYN